MHYAKVTKVRYMKKQINNIQSRLNYDEYKNIINDHIANKTIDKLKLQEDYFDIFGNYWIIDKYICQNGQIDETITANSKQAYEECIANNYAISIPLQMLDDGNIVCCAHKNLSKIIDTMSGYLNNLSINEIKKLDLGNGETMLTLEEALDIIAAKTEIILEISNDGSIGKFEQKVLNIVNNYINKYDCYNKVAIMAINPYSLEYIYELCPYIVRILKSGNFTEKYYGSIKTKKLKKLKYYKITHADFISYSYELLPSSYVEKHKPIGTLAYNVTNQNQYLSVAEHADNIIFSHFTPTI